MKTLQKTLLALAAGSLLTVGAQAATSYSNGYTGQPYVGVKVGQFDLDIDNADDPTAYGVYGGYNFDQNFGVEAEYVGSDDADYRNGCSCTNTPCRSKKLCGLNFYVSDRLASQETQFFRKNFELLQRCQQRKEKQEI